MSGGVIVALLILTWLAGSIAGWGLRGHRLWRRAERDRPRRPAATVASIDAIYRRHYGDLWTSSPER